VRAKDERYIWVSVWCSLHRREKKYQKEKKEKTHFKLLMTFTPRIASMLHVFSLKIFDIAAQCLQGYPRSKTTHTFPFTWCLKTVHRNSLIAYYRPTRALHGLSFRFAVYRFHLLVRVWFVFIVLDLDVLGLLRWLSSMIRVAPPYLFLCTYYLPKRHMMSNFIYSFINFCNS